MPADAQPAGSPSAGQRVALLLIRGYQMLFSPLFAGSCRFTPSCSRYAADAIKRFGVLRGSYLAMRRLSRCHPFGAHGVDPIPDFAPRVLRRGKPS